MPLQGSRVGIIGGSIAGCAAAVALTRAGCEVEVFERSSRELRDRGSGILIPLPLREQLIEAGYLPPAYASCELRERWWLLHDDSPAGRRLWRQASSGATNNWGVLWRSLRAHVPDERYHDGVALTDLEHDADEVRAEFSDGETRAFDLLVGADGYRSVVRQQLHPDSRPRYTGYVLWRGNYPESELEQRDAIDHADEASAWYTVCFEGGHGVVYMIPDFDDGTAIGQRRVNWAIYAPQPPALEFEEATSIAPGDVDASTYAHLERILDEDFPADQQAIVRASPRAEVSIQPIYDEAVDSYVTGRVMLIGDAGTVSRPHTGSGATKALQDALALEQLAQEHSDWDDLLAAYNTERVEVGRSLVEMGRRIGRAQVEETPDWGSMSPHDFEAWTEATLAGEQLYLYGDTRED